MTKKFLILFISSFFFLCSPTEDWQTIIDWYGKIPAGKYVYWKFYFEKGTEIKGIISVAENDINFFIITDDWFEEYHNGNPFERIWGEERTKYSSFNLIIPKSDYYYFILSNRYSIFTDKWVAIKVEKRK